MVSFRFFSAEWRLRVGEDSDTDDKRGVLGVKERLGERLSVFHITVRGRASETLSSHDE
jgi:hypothetical protein